MASLASVIQTETDHLLYEQIMLHAKGDMNDQILAVILSSWITKQGALPQYLGLSLMNFKELVNAHFPGLRISENIRQDKVFDPERMPEKDDLLKLFSGYRANKSRSEIWISQIITAACLGSDHLWQDLGLWDRNQLSSLIANNFPALAEKNIKNMKWKKFLYKQLCDEEGIYTCRSPSCEVCADFNVCFGKEE